MQIFSRLCRNILMTYFLEQYLKLIKSFFGILLHYYDLFIRRTAWNVDFPTALNAAFPQPLRSHMR